MTREQSGLRGLSERGFTALDHARESIGRRRTDEFRAVVDAGDLRGAGGPDPKGLAVFCYFLARFA